MKRSLTLALPWIFMTLCVFAQSPEFFREPPPEANVAPIMVPFFKDAERMKGAAQIGRRIFEDQNLSEPIGVSCASCHDPQKAFADPRPVSPGARPGEIGHRNAPSLMYVALVPPRFKEQIVKDSGEIIMAWEGGLFLDGRVRDTFEQVQGPLFASNEMNLPDRSELARRLRSSNYAEAMRKWVGDSPWNDDEKLNYFAFRALAEFLKEPVFRPFDARIDDFLGGDQDALSEAEKRGLEVFKGAGKCADCHLLEAVDWPQALLSDYGYDNLGVPSRGAPDPGLGAITKDNAELGQFRAPSLRNIALTAPYMHNGSIATLREVMEFYNSRDIEPDRWGKTDYPATVNHEDLGNLKLSEQQILDLTALMDSFTDRTLLKCTSEKRAFPEAHPQTRSTEELRITFPGWNFHFDAPPVEEVSAGSKLPVSTHKQ